MLADAAAANKFKRGEYFLKADGYRLFVSAKRCCNVGNRPEQDERIVL
jgi:hypothetical protein